MAVMSGIVLFCVIWAMVFMIALPIRVQTQGDLGQVVEGTHAGAPEHHHLKRKRYGQRSFPWFCGQSLPGSYCRAGLPLRMLKTSCMGIRHQLVE